MSKEIVFAECKFQNKPMDVDVYYDLLRKKELVGWNKQSRHERFVLFSISGFTDGLKKVAGEEDNLLLFRHTPHQDL